MQKLHLLMILQVHHVHYSIEKWDLWEFSSSLFDPWCTNVNYELNVASCLLYVNIAKFPLPKYLNSFILKSPRKSNHIVTKICQFISQKRLTLNLASWKKQYSNEFSKIKLNCNFANSRFLQSLCTSIVNSITSRLHVTKIVQLEILIVQFLAWTNSRLNHSL